MTKQLTVSRLLIPLHSPGLFDGLHVIDQIDPSHHRITLCARLSGTAASCPGCRTESRRVHGHYWRCLGDLPCFGRPVILRVHVRRFRCVNDAWLSAAVLSQTDTESRQSLWIALVWWKKALERF